MQLRIEPTLFGLERANCFPFLRLTHVLSFLLPYRHYLERRFFAWHFILNENILF